MPTPPRSAWATRSICCAGRADWYALAVANSWFGEHRNSSSHLFQVIRDQRGLNYGDYSYLEHFPNGGCVDQTAAERLPPPAAVRNLDSARYRTRPGNSPCVRRCGNSKSLVDGGLTEDQFDLTRKFLRNYVLHYAPTTSERLGYALDDRFYGISGSHLDLFRRAMSEVTRADVNASVKKYLQYDNLQIVFVTPDAEGLKKALVADAPSPISYATPKPDALLAEDRQISAFPLKIRPEDVKVVPVGQLFAK